MKVGEDPITPDECLYRRIPDSTGWYDSQRIPPIEPEAFRANKNDSSGISISRAKYTTLKQAATGRPGKTYWVAVFQAKDVFELGMSIAPCPLDGNAGHAEITDLIYENRKSRQSIEWRNALVKLVSRVEGPFTNVEQS